MSTERVSVTIDIDTSDATEKLADAWWQLARIAYPLLSEGELEEKYRAEFGVSG
jgi:hypothetical protein